MKRLKRWNNFVLVCLIVLKWTGVTSSENCPPIPFNCDPECIRYEDRHCKKCDCDSKDSDMSPMSAGNSPFDQGQSLFQTPYSASISGMPGSGFSLNNMAGISGNGRNSYPAMFMQDGRISMNSHQKCLRHIVCPQYCHQIDENGCETCPCGPASGMLPGGYSSGYSPQQQKQDNGDKEKQCLHTLLCMLSCKEGYELGKKGNDGCQSCKCTKQKGSQNTQQGSGDQGTGNNNSKNKEGTGSVNGQNGASGSGGGNEGTGGFMSNTNQGIGSGDGMSSGSGFNPMFPGLSMGLSGGSGSSGGDGCVGPFCAGGSGMGGGSGGGSGGGMGGMMMSPFGLAATGGGGGAGTFGFPSKSNGAHSTAKGETIKGVPGIDCFGPECSAKNGMKLTQTASTSTAVKEKIKCPSTDLCIRTCKHDLKLGPESSDGCPTCACLIPTEAPTTKTPHQNLCERVVRCMLDCTSGYQLGTSDGSGCPACTCNTPKVVATTTTAAPVRQPSCEDTIVLCMKSCRYGYHLLSSDQGKCPLCRCLPPPTTTLAPTKKPDVYAILKNCPDAVHCMLNCKTGYQLESDGNMCPICTCNQVAVMTLTCSASLSCPYGCKVGYRNGDKGCPTCDCVKPVEVGIMQTGVYLQASLVCGAHFSCSSICEFGYKSGDNSCPTCQCLMPVKGHTLQIVPNQTNTSTVVLTSGCKGSSCGHSGTEVITGTGHMSHETYAGSAAHVTTSNGIGCSGSNCGHTETLTPEQTLAVLSKYCPNVERCAMNCHHGFSLSGSEAGKCPTCTCNAGKTPTLQQICPETYQCGGKCPNGFVLKNEEGKDCPTCFCISGTIVNGQSTGAVSSVTSGSLSLPEVTTNKTNTHHTSTINGHNVPQVQTSLTSNNGQSSSSSNSAGHVGNSVVSSITGHTSGVNGHSATQAHPPGSAPSSNIGHMIAPSIPGHVSHPVGHRPGVDVDCLGPECSAKNGLHTNHKVLVNSQKSRLSPSQCAELLQCVLTCKYGYKLKEKDERGCPGCECIRK